MSKICTYHSYSTRSLIINDKSRLLFSHDERTCSSLAAKSVRFSEKCAWMLHSRTEVTRIHGTRSKILSQASQINRASKRIKTEGQESRPVLVHMCKKRGDTKKRCLGEGERVGRVNDRISDKFRGASISVINRPLLVQFIIRVERNASFGIKSADFRRLKSSIDAVTLGVRTCVRACIAAARVRPRESFHLLANSPIGKRGEPSKAIIITYVGWHYSATF